MDLIRQGKQNNSSHNRSVNEERDSRSLKQQGPFLYAHFDKLNQFPCREYRLNKFGFLISGGGLFPKSTLKHLPYYPKSVIFAPKKVSKNKKWRSLTSSTNY